jgi:hypothetical protein
MLSPALGTITCDAVCAFTAQDGGAAMTITCHEHQAHHHSGAAVKGMLPGPCHDGGASPDAVLFDSLQQVAVPAGATGTAVAPSLDRRQLTRARVERSRSPGSPPQTSQLRI